MEATVDKNMVVYGHELCKGCNVSTSDDSSHIVVVNKFDSISSQCVMYPINLANLHNPIMAYRFIQQIRTKNNLD